MAAQLRRQGTVSPTQPPMVPGRLLRRSLAALSFAVLRACPVTSAFAGVRACGWGRVAYAVEVPLPNLAPVRRDAVSLRCQDNVASVAPNTVQEVGA